MAEVAAAVKKYNGAREPYQARLGSRMKPREAFRNVFTLLVEAGITTADLLRQGCFDVVAQTLRPRDTIEVFSLDTKKFWELIVLDSGIGWATVHLLREHDLPAVSQVDRDVLEGFELHKNPENGWWFAIRKVDRQAMFKQEQIKTKDALVARVQNDATVRQR